MSAYKVLRRIRLSPQHGPTGNTRHVRGGQPLPPPHELKVVQYPEDEGFYLLHFDARGEELTDTYHESIEDALAQADWEFNVRADEWEAAGDS